MLKQSSPQQVLLVRTVRCAAAELRAAVPLAPSWIAITLLLSSCASLTAEKCKEIDPFRKGRLEALSGETASDFPQVRHDCFALGAPLDLAQYVHGRDDGLKEFCTRKNGYHWGTQGKTYRGSCPATQAAEFMAGYREGNKQFRVEEEKRVLREKVADLEQRQKRLEALNKMGTHECTFDSDCGEHGHCGFESVCNEPGDCEQLEVCRKKP